MNPIRNKMPYSAIIDGLKSEQSKLAYSSDYAMFDVYLGGRHPYQASKEEIRAWILQMRGRGLSDNTLARRIAALNKLYQDAVEMDAIPKSPMSVLRTLEINPKKRNPKALTVEQRAHLLKSLRWRRRHDYAVSMFVLLTWHEGLRASEARLLEWAQVDFAEKEITVLRGKGDKDRMVPMSELVLKKLKGLKRSGPYLFPNMDKTTPWYWCAKIVKGWCGWGPDVKFSPHVGRHVFGSQLIESGVSLPETSELMGHGDTKTTMIYVKILAQAKKKSHADTFNKK